MRKRNTYKKDQIFEGRGYRLGEAYEKTIYNR